MSVWGWGEDISQFSHPLENSKNCIHHSIVGMFYQMKISHKNYQTLILHLKLIWGKYCKNVYFQPPLKNRTHICMFYVESKHPEIRFTTLKIACRVNNI